MHSFDPIETFSLEVISLCENELKNRIMNFKGRFKLDFTEEYLDNQSPERLRHILLAAFITYHEPGHLVRS